MNKLFSGIKPTGKIHLGNYLGALKNWVELQEKYQCLYFIADLHALTIKINPDELIGATNLGVCFAQTGQYNRAQSIFLGILKKYPDHIATQNNLGSIAIKTGDKASAITYFQRVLALDANNRIAQANLEMLNRAP